MKNKKNLHPGLEIKRLIFEYEDGTVKYLEGDAARKYLEQINNVLVFMQGTRSHMLPKDFLKTNEWKKIDVDKAGKIFSAKV